MTKPRSIAACLCAALGMLAGLTGIARSEDNEMIVAGTEAPDGKFPYQVRLYASDSDLRGFCGGSLIAPQWVLTASHCLAEEKQGSYVARSPEAVVVGYGSNDRTKTTKVDVVKVIVRPEFLDKGLNGKADVALLKLKEPIANPQTVPLADPDADKKYLVPGAKVTVSGWGTLWSYDDDVASLVGEFGSDMEEKVTAPIKLREVEVDWIDNDACNAAFAAETRRHRHRRYRILRLPAGHQQRHLPGRFRWSDGGARRERQIRAGRRGKLGPRLWRRDSRRLCPGGQV